MLVYVPPYLGHTRLVFVAFAIIGGVGQVKGCSVVRLYGGSCSAVFEEQSKSFPWQSRPTPGSSPITPSQTHPCLSP